MSLKKLAQQIKKEMKELEKGVDELFLEKLDEYMIQKAKENEKESSLSFKPSQYYKCARKLWYEFFKTQKSDEHIYARSIRILEIGTLLHQYIQDKLLDISENDGFVKIVPLEELPIYNLDGIELIKEHDSHPIEVKFRDYRWTKQIPVSAMVDGFIEINNLRMIFEFKTINSKDFDLLYQPLKEHLKQGALYALCLGVKRVLFVYFNKDTQQLKAFLKEYNDEQIEWVKRRLVFLEEHILEQKLPPKEENENNCQYCPYKKLCKEDRTF